MSRSATKLKAWDIYAKELRDLGFGHPLWVPEPSPESGEVQLGDIGYLSQGKFCFLFNCMRSADDPVNRKGVPDGFQVFVPPDGPAEESAKSIRNCIMDPLLLSGHAYSVNFSANASISTDPVAHAQGAMSYEMERQTGACLALKRPAHQTSLHCTEAIFRYLQAHHSQWCKYATQSRGRKIDGAQILFVTGFVKTAAWAVGAFKHESSSATLKIDTGAMFGGGLSASAGAAISVTDCSQPMSLHRYGPAERLPWAEDELHPDDQCIFLHYAHIKYRFFRRRRRVLVVSNASPEDSSENEEESDDCAVDGEALDYIFQQVSPTVNRSVSVGVYACATSQDLYALRQADLRAPSQGILQVRAWRRGLPEFGVTELNDLRVSKSLERAFCLSRSVAAQAKGE
ncbi:hypothetical protein L227DRAFT_157437 [Lentinus tigrinus ALCF2SS1-6]|uniref:Uncharacterized protein n=1 Tax=Lentinus tigrinus ALCF2SS1-6 TaxID=1328759 RepID=A0A5C2S8Y4_9APHY|nr:hypothetical protein L227DRAFT_157437 [Lentinus tigrinus ALCF2SS1-6]